MPTAVWPFTVGLHVIYNILFYLCLFIAYLIHLLVMHAVTCPSEITTAVLGRTRTLKLSDTL